MKKLLVAMVLLMVVLSGCGLGQDPRAEAIANAVAQQKTQDGSTLDTTCGAYAVISAALQGGDSKNVKERAWTAWSEDPQKRAWKVKCMATYTVLTTKGEKSVTEQILLLMVDYDRWEVTWVPGHTEEIELLGTFGDSLPMALDPAKKP